MTTPNYFQPDELRCKCGCGEYLFSKDALYQLNQIRHECGFLFPISSGYRCANHPIEAKKAIPGAHNEGVAVDIQVTGWQAFEVIEVALRYGVRRVGVNQKGPRKERFIHLDWSTELPSPMLWSY